MSEAWQAVRLYLRHVAVVPGEGCTCPEDSWAPCGGQYEGRYNAACALHGRRAPEAQVHFPAGCPAR